MNSIGSQYGGMARAWKKQGPAIGYYKREMVGGAFTPNVVLQAAGSGIPWPIPIQPLRQTARRPPGAWDVTPGSYLESVYGPELPALSGEDMSEDEDDIGDLGDRAARMARRKKRRGKRGTKRAEHEERALTRLYVVSRKQRGLRHILLFPARFRIQLARGKRKTGSLNKGFVWALQRVLPKDDPDQKKIGHGGIAKAMIQAAGSNKALLAMLQRLHFQKEDGADTGDLVNLSGLVIDTGDLGVASRVRLVAGMKRELVKRKAGIKVFQKQLKAAKGDEAAKLHELISKYQKRIQELREAIKEKQERKGGRGRWLERAKTRLSTFAGFDMDEDDVDTAGVFNLDSGWWKPVLVIGAIGFMAWYAPKLDTKRQG